MKSIDTSIIQGAIESLQGGRSENQDAYGCAESAIGEIVVVCDGMGGGPGGRYASTMAVHEVIEYITNYDGTLDNGQVLEAAIRHANQKMLEEQLRQPSLRGMGSTIVALLINDYSAFVAHVGDSRVYQIRFGRKKFRTFDHSHVFELVRLKKLSEEQARLSATSNIITQALGIRADVRVDVQELPYERGDYFMLCTDGIWGMLPEKELIRRVVKSNRIPTTVDLLTTQIDEQGKNEGGHHDNMTIALVETKHDSILKEKMTRNVRIIMAVLIALLGLSLLGNLMQGGPSESQSVNQRMLDSLSRINGGKDEIIRNNQKQIDSLKAAIKYLEDKIQLQGENLEDLRNNQSSRQNSLLESYLSELNELIDLLEKTRDMKKSSQKDRSVNKIRQITKDLSSKDMISQFGMPEDSWKAVREYVGNSCMKDDDKKYIKHYDEIIKILNGIKEKLLTK